MVRDGGGAGTKAWWHGGTKARSEAQKAQSTNGESTNRKGGSRFAASTSGDPGGGQSRVITSNPRCPNSFPRRGITDGPADLNFIDAARGRFDRLSRCSRPLPAVPRRALGAAGSEGAAALSPEHHAHHQVVARWLPCCRRRRGLQRARLRFIIRHDRDRGGVSGGSKHRDIRGDALQPAAMSIRGRRSCSMKGGVVPRNRDCRGTTRFGRTEQCVWMVQTHSWTFQLRSSTVQLRMQAREQWVGNVQLPAQTCAAHSSAGPSYRSASQLQSFSAQLPSGTAETSKRQGSEPPRVFCGRRSSRMTKLFRSPQRKTPPRAQDTMTSGISRCSERPRNASFTPPLSTATDRDDTLTRS